jgi:hypothetical protein
MDLKKSQPLRLTFFDYGLNIGNVLVGPDQPASAFLVVQLRGLEARGHMSNHPKRQRAPFRMVCHMLVASEQSPSAFLVVQLRGLEARGHMSNHPKRQRAPFRMVRHMLVASEQSPSAFLIVKNLS